jgi:PAS domain S-box-containing protein
MRVSQEQPENFVASFAQQRQRLLAHAGTLLTDGRLEDQPDAIARLSQMLAASLEVMKVAEGELEEAGRVQAANEAIRQRRLDHLQALFDLAPTALILTTADTTVRESNQAAAALFGRDVYGLQGLRLGTMVARDQQATFREQLALVLEIEKVPAWTFTIARHGNVPCAVIAAVHLIEDVAVGTRALYWNFRPSGS